MTMAVGQMRVADLLEFNFTIREECGCNVIIS
jgi:hypothetical protein